MSFCLLSAFPFLLDFPPLSSPWPYVAVILEILCVVLLGAVGFQSVKRKYFQERQRKDPEFQKFQQRGQYNCSLCPENWIQHEEDCYHFSTEWRTWQESKDYCSSQGSKLLKIHTFSYHWIGLFRNGINEFWVWEDGTSTVHVCFIFSFAEHPDFNSGDCAAFRTGEAHSYDCAQSKLYICEQRAQLPSPPNKKQVQQFPILVVYF
uniref:Natural killer cells antigen CD94 n=1 Tax=Gopherus agassizii TaxID=38772 RepID=A0A452ID60_9SAUR